MVKSKQEKSKQEKLSIMYSFIKKYTETMQDQNIYPLFSLLVFVIFFVAVLWYVKVLDKKEVEEIKNLPLEQ